MPKWLKWLLISIAALMACVVLALLIAPMFIDIQQYKPVVERKVSEAVGRSFAIEGDLSLSFFPWAGISFSELHLGNPEGFETTEMLSVQSFDVRVKLLPLIRRDIQVKRFVIQGVRIALEKNQKGQANWQGFGSEAASEKPSAAKPSTESTPMELPIRSLEVGECALKDGELVYIDQTQGLRRVLTDFNLVLQDVSLHRPVQLQLSARLDSRPLALEGSIGPLGTDIGKGKLPLDLALKVFDELQLQLKGHIDGPAGKQNFDLALQIPPFSPRKMLHALDSGQSLQTRDPDVLQKLALDAHLRGSPQAIKVTDGVLTLDDSKIDFSAGIEGFDPPKTAFKFNLDRIDADRYLPPASEEAAEAEVQAASADAGAATIDYTPLRRLVLDGQIKIGRLKIQGAVVQDIDVRINGRQGRFLIDPMDLKLYEGVVDGEAEVDVRRSRPKTRFALRSDGVQVNPLLNDLLQKDFLEGTLKSTVTLTMEGDSAETIKSSLNGQGDLLFSDGAIKGVDLTSMVRNIKAGFGMAASDETPPRTDFSRLSLPFTFTNGLFKTDDTQLASPLLRLAASGRADLVEETLDFRITPKFVATLKGQGDTDGRGGIMVPVIVSGSFAAPKFKPDLEGMLKQKLPQPSDLKKMLKGSDDPPKNAQDIKESIKGLVPKLPF